jgi:hypothetical protein
MLVLAVCTPSSLLGLLLLAVLACEDYRNLKNV